LIHWIMYKDVAPLAYNSDTQKYINITSYLETETQEKGEK